MKKIAIAFSITLLIGSTACNDESRSVKPTGCIECMGCFGGWTECADSWQPAPGDSSSWEQHVTYMTTQTQATFSCTRSN